jgi:Ala-tRNA(Pro) deacylase
MLAVLPAPMHVDLGKVAAALQTEVRLAAEDDVVAVFPDCERGAAAPFGRLYGVPTLLEDSVAPDDHIVFEAQRHGMAIRMRCRDFERLEEPQRMALARLRICVRCEPARDRAPRRER